MVTGSRVRIIPSPSADTAKTGDWQEGAIYYDGKGRAIYSASWGRYHDDVIREDYTASQYDFTGKVLTTKHIFTNHNGTDALNEHKEWTVNEYDATTGRLNKTKHRVDNGGWQVLAMYQYDGMGRVRKNILGNYGEVRDMSYNIRGQLDGINAVYAETGNKQGENRTFGESLKYDYGFTYPRYDGRIAGMVWRGSDADNGYAYGYSYDKSGRLTQADFRRKHGTAGAWGNQTVDYSVSNLDYDLNGNIQSMRQRGMGAVNGSIVPVTIDDLTYTYNDQSNQLLKVTDPQDDYHTGDFVNTNGNDDDYDYDASGNLRTDANKGISGITYTHLNKPQVVYMDHNRRIEYSYDAAGTKVQELVIDDDAISPAPAVKRTDYLSNYVYADDKVQYLSTGVGRSTFQVNGSTKEEFFVKDHLGNVRSMIDVYTYPIDEYLATYEVASANLENMFFERMDEVRDDRPGANWTDLKSARLNGADPERRVGTSMLIHVMAGDKVEMNVNSFYENYDEQEDHPLSAQEMLDNIVGTLTSGVGGSIAGELHDSKRITNALNWPNFEAFQNLTQGSVDPSKPKAFLNYILFDENMHIVPEGSGSFQANGNGTWTQIGTILPVEMTQNGYLAVYLSNNTDMSGSCLNCGDVFFDQLVFRLSRGKLKEESHYYPFGLPIAGMGSVALDGKPNRRKYQGNEYIQELGLNWMDFNARQYDPQLGRFLGVDPLAASHGQDRYSPYAAMGNAPESMIDPNGTTFTVSGDLVAAGEMLDNWLGHDNYDLINKTVTIKEGHEEAALSHLTAYFMGNNIGGGSAGTAEQMAANAASWIMAMIGDKDTKNLNMNANSSGTIGLTLSVYKEGDYKAVTFDDHNMRASIENGMNGVLKAQSFDDASRNPDGFQIAKNITDAGGKGTLIPSGAIDFVKNTRVGRTLATGEEAYTLSFARSMKTAGKVTKWITAVNIGITLVAVGNDISKGHYKSATARGVVAAISAGAAFIPVVGWGVSLGIGIADAIWGDEVYEYIEKNW